MEVKVAGGRERRDVFTAIALAFSTYAVAAGVLFRRDRWKHAVV